MNYTVVPCHGPLKWALVDNLTGKTVATYRDESRARRAAEVK